MKTPALFVISCVLLCGLHSHAQNAQRTPAWMMPRIEGPGLHYQTFDSKLAGEKVSYLLYLPPGYESSGTKRYPVMYWLHGIGGSQHGVPAITARLTSAMEAGKCPEFIAVFANGMIHSFYCDAVREKRPVESVIVQELIPHLDATQRTIATREARLIEGFSMGGFGAGHLGFKYPELFGSVSMIDGALVDLNTMRQRHAPLFESIFGGQEAVFAAAHPRTLVEKNATSIRGRTVVRQTVGALAGPNEAMHQQLDNLGIEHDYDVFSDAGHNAGVLHERLGDKNWDFYRRAFANVAGSTSIPAAPAPAPTASPMPLVSGLQLNGEQWTYRDGEFAMSGILLKPPGKGPFPAVLISHGLGGAAQSFGMMKAREMVQWGMVCIAPDYTHNARAAGGQRANGVRDMSGFGASAENLRRAKTCVGLLKQLPEVDRTRIAAYGHSMGGFVTIGLAAAEPGILKSCAITGSGVAPQEGYPAPSEAAAAMIRSPFLMLHGALDTTVRPAQSEALKRILDRNRVPNERRVADGQGHPIDQTMRDEVFRAVRGWFEKQGVLTRS
jgi:endo-1,4-beta-xylanase